MTAAEWKISTSGGTKPLWARDGRELFYVSPDGAIMSVRVDTHGGAWGAGTPAKLVEGPYAISSTSGARTYDVSPDGQRFLVVKPAKQHAAPQIIVWQRWVEEKLKRLLPAG